jgi:hypothetical protein
MSSSSNGKGQARPIPPGLHEGEKKINAPIEPPVNFKQRPVDPTRLKQEADELAKLSAALPSQIDLVSRGQLPKDLADQLKRIEKLARQLRSEISQ